MDERYPAGEPVKVIRDYFESEGGEGPYRGMEGAVVRDERMEAGMDAGLVLVSIVRGPGERGGPLDVLAPFRLGKEVVPVSELGDVAGASSGNPGAPSAREREARMPDDPGDGEGVPYDEGWRARHEGASLDSNPYDEGTEDFDRWEDGWYDARKAITGRAFG